MNRTIVWFRRDLRISDHAPLHRAASRGLVIPVFVLDRALLHHPETSSARVAFMLACLHDLDQELQKRGGRLILRSGNPIDVLPQLIRETQADGIYAYIDYERIYGRVRDAQLNATLTEQNLKIRWFEPTAGMGDLVSAPEYGKHWYAEMNEAQVPTPGRILTPDLPSDPLPTLAELGLIADRKPIPPGGTQPARQLLQDFISQKADRYYWQLSYPNANATSGLSPYIKFGAISIRECYQTVRFLKDSPDYRIQRSGRQLINRLRWGSGFAQRFRYLPQLELRSLYTVFEKEGWTFNEDDYQAWQSGNTGFPIVDAAARCLLETGGWKEMNFRTRALYASFLSNLLGMDWRYGALHFMRHLIDGDCPIDHYQWAMQAGVTHCANKTWTRIYNPGQTAVNRCDPEGLFIKRWVPELANLPIAALGSPPRINGYPSPILNYKTARQQRVQQLLHQRQTFLQSENVLPQLARLPDSFLPFGYDRVSCDIAWAQSESRELFPPPLNLDDLDLEQSKRLRTWFVSPAQATSRSNKSTPRSSKPPANVQLSLLE
ncbi:cryptochrome/photolyase family protein [Phormidesmis sp. 146-33]